MESQAIAGIYDLLDIVLEKLDRIERNQEKERISRAFSSAYNETSQEQSELLRVDLGQQSRSNIQRALSSRRSFRPISSLARNATDEPFLDNSSPDIRSVTDSNASEPTENAFSSNAEKNDVQNLKGPNYFRNENEEREQQQDGLSLDQTRILERNEKRKLQQQEHEERRLQKLRKSRQDGSHGDDDENQPFQDLLFAEEVLSDEEEIPYQELPLAGQEQQVVRFRNEKDSERLQEIELNVIPNDSLLQMIQQTPENKATDHGEDMLLDDENALNRSARRRKSGKKVTVNVAKTKRRRENIVARRRRNRIVNSVATKNNQINSTISQSDFEASDEIDSLLGFLKYKLHNYNKTVTDKRRTCTNIKGKIKLIYDYMAKVTSQILKNRQHVIQHHSWSRLSDELQKEILSEIEYEVQKKYGNVSVSFGECIDHWPTRIMMKYVFPTYMEKKTLPYIPIPFAGSLTSQMNPKNMLQTEPENVPEKPERRTPMVEPNLDDDDDDTIAD